MISEVDIRDWQQTQFWPDQPTKIDVIKSMQDQRPLSERQEAFDRITKVYTEAVNKEYDPNGKSPNEPGAKLDAGKAPLYRGLIDYFPRACQAIAEVSEVGAKKYTWRGWETVPDGYNRYSDALLRHVSKGTYELLDQDTNLTHAAHAAWNALARLELLLKDN